MICKVCASLSRAEIDRQLQLGRLSLRKLGAKFNFTASALHRHRTGCLRKEEEAREIQSRGRRRGLFGRSPLICNCDNPVFHITYEDQPIKNYFALGHERHPFRRTLEVLIASTQSHDIREEKIGVYAAKLLALLDKELPAHVAAAVEEAERELDKRLGAESAPSAEEGLNGLA